MRLRRRLTKDGPGVEIATHGGWLALAGVRQLGGILGDHGISGSGASDVLPLLQLGVAGRRALASELVQTPPEPFPEGPLLLPFTPCSLRDFMLYERHAIDAARGFARRFLPAAYRLAQTVEAITRRPFPKFRAHRLWYAQPIYYFGHQLSFLDPGQ